jgi:hypothetical protein
MKDTFSVYEVFTASRFKPGASIKADLDAGKAEITHACFGIATELYEISLSQTEENKIEEIGDCLFYVQGLCNVFNLSLREIASVNRVYESTPFTLIGDILDTCKPHIFYNKPLDVVALKQYLADLVDYLRDECMTCSTTLERCIRENMRKLTTRYPTGYSDAAAQARADKKEGE